MGSGIRNEIRLELSCIRVAEEPDSDAFKYNYFIASNTQLGIGPDYMGSHIFLIFLRYIRLF